MEPHRQLRQIKPILNTQESVYNDSSSQEEAQCDQSDSPQAGSTHLTKALKEENTLLKQKLIDMETAYRSIIEELKKEIALLKQKIDDKDAKAIGRRLFEEFDDEVVLEDPSSLEKVEHNQGKQKNSLSKQGI